MFFSRCCPIILLFPVEVICCMCVPTYWYQTDRMAVWTIGSYYVFSENTWFPLGSVTNNMFRSGASRFKLVYSWVIASYMRESYRSSMEYVFVEPCTRYLVPGWLHVWHIGQLFQSLSSMRGRPMCDLGPLLANLLIIIGRVRWPCVTVWSLVINHHFQTWSCVA